MIQHVTRQIQPSELDLCVAFYGILGFRQVRPPAGVEGRAVWLERSGSHVHLMPVDEPKAPPAGDHAAPATAPSAEHVGIVVDRYEETLALLRADGYAVQPRREHWGSPRAYVRDPAGNLVELMAWAPAAPASP